MQGGVGTALPWQRLSSAHVTGDTRAEYRIGPIPLHPGELPGVGHERQDMLAQLPHPRCGRLGTDGKGVRAVRTPSR